VRLLLVSGSTDLSTMAFRIDSTHVADTDDWPVWTGRVKWLDERTESIREVLEARGDGGEAVSATAEAADWLADHLTSLGDTDHSGSTKAGTQDRALRKRTQARPEEDQGDDQHLRLPARRSGPCRAPRPTIRVSPVGSSLARVN
jgi:hypothetical protein